MRWYLWIDLDAYYVSCEIRDRPDLQGKPVIVGPDPRAGPTRGVVLSASYEARPSGVRSAMPAAQAARLCPDATWIPADHDKYARIAEEVRELLRREQRSVVPRSIDEATVEFDSEDPAEVASRGRQIQESLRTTLRLPASIGASPYRTVAKIASDRAKPGGVVVVAPGETAEFLAPLSVRAIPGIGPKTGELLKGEGVERIGQLADPPPPRLRRLLGPFLSELTALARGRPRESEEQETGPHSRSADHTFVEDVGDLDTLLIAARELADSLADSLEKEHWRFQTVRVAVRWQDFQRVQRGRTLPAHQGGPEALRAVSSRLLRELWAEERRGRRRRVRLLSVGVERLIPAGGGQRRIEEFAAGPTVK